MIFSSVLKTRLSGFLRKVESAIGIAVAIIDEHNCALVKSNSFDENWLSENSNGKLRYEKLQCQGCQFQIAGSPLELQLEEERAEKLFALVRENVEFLITTEQEAQGLAQEVLEKYEELNLLYDLISELSVIFDERKICQLTLEKAMRVLNVSGGAIFLKQDNENEISLICSSENNQIQKISKPEKLAEFALKSLRCGKELLFDKRNKLPDWYFENIANQELWSLLAVPIIASEKTLGSMILIGKMGDDTFQSGDIKLAEAIARYAGITINSNRMVEQMRIAEALAHEMKLARNIQQSLLPRFLPETEKFEIAAICQPAADVGGDYFFVGNLGNGKWEITIADVSGHGIGAALTMASLRSILRSESRLRDKVSEIVKSANGLLCHDTEETGMYATLVLARYDDNSGELFYCNAGHQIPMILRHEGQKVELLEKGGLPVGMFADEDYRQNRTTLASGDFLILFTDGITEARNEENLQFGEERLIKLLKDNASNSAQIILEKIVEGVQEFQSTNLQRDDITIVILKRK